jgi:type I restriction enzyme S subunit
MEYPAYDSYKPCSIDWIDKVPSHWVTWKVTHGFNLVGSGTTPKSDNQAYYEGGGTPWITTSELREKEIIDTKYKLTETALKDYPTLKVYKPGSLAFAMYGATIGRLGILGIDATVNQACCVFDEPEQFDTKFFFYWLWMRRDVLISLSVGGGQPNLSQDDLKQIRAPIPPVFEQHKIAEFLDYKTLQLDQLIEKKKILIEKLEEKRIAVVTRAVTMGIDKNVKLKPSAFDWLADVPEHWKTNYKFNFLALSKRNSFVNGPFGSDLLTSEIMNEGVPVIYSGDVKASGFKRKSNGYVTELKAKELDFCRADPGDFFMAKVGAPPGEACVYSYDEPSAIVTQDVVRAKLDESEVSAEYLCFLFNSLYGKYLMKLISVEATRGRFSLSDLKGVRLLIPPKDEQLKIVDYINEQIIARDKLRKLIEKEIDTLNEYRSAIITSAVTGKIDIRDIGIPKALA